MFKKFLELLGKRKPNDAVENRGEYDLLIKNNRITDYSSQPETSSLDLRIGFYLDTYKHLTTGINHQAAKSNISLVLSQAGKEYQKLLYDKYGVKNTTDFIDGKFPKSYARVQKQFEIENIITRRGAETRTLCLNFMVRYQSDPYLLIGKKPKGKITREQRIQAKKRKWDDYTHL